MSTSIDGVDPTIVNITTEVTDIVVFSATGPEGPQGPAGPEGPAFQGNAIALINPVTGLALQPGETFPVSGTLEVDLPPITIPPIELPPIEFPDQLNANVLNWPASQTINGTITVSNPVSTVAVSSLPAVTLTGPITVEPVEFAPGQTMDVNILSGGSTFDGQLTQDGEPVSDQNPLSVTVTNLPEVQEVSGAVTISAEQAIPVSGSITVTNQPTSMVVSNLPDVQEVSGTVAITAASAIPVSGSISVSNHPTSMTISNLPVSQTINGTVTLDGPISVAPHSSVGAKLLLDDGSPSGAPISNANGVPMKPADGAVFIVASGGQPLNVAVQNQDLPVSISQPVSVNPEFTSLAIGAVTINSTSTPVALISATAKAVDVVNHTTTDVEYQIGSSGPYMILAAKSADFISPVTNASQIRFRLRAAGDPITLSYKVLS